MFITEIFRSYSTDTEKGVAKLLLVISISGITCKTKVFHPTWKDIFLAN